MTEHSDFGKSTDKEKKYYAKILNNLRIKINLFYISFPVWGILLIIVSTFDNKIVLKILLYAIYSFYGYLFVWLLFFRCPRCNHHLRRIRGWIPEKCWFCGLSLDYQYKPEKNKGKRKRGSDQAKSLN